ncbi:hypothetical protein GGR56DRAFT_231933 [Xylariaceae sp. FL0804]|nr:hypothetical protein GGR56DRAFT_231933 [Xylariaceae sp. FL0804]
MCLVSAALVHPGLAYSGRGRSGGSAVPTIERRRAPMTRPEMSPLTSRCGVLEEESSEGDSVTAAPEQRMGARRIISEIIFRRPKGRWCLARSHPDLFPQSSESAGTEKPRTAHNTDQCTQMAWRRRRQVGRRCVRQPQPLESRPSWPHLRRESFIRQTDVDVCLPYLPVTQASFLDQDHRSRLDSSTSTLGTTGNFGVPVVPVAQRRTDAC